MIRLLKIKIKGRSSLYQAMRRSRYIALVSKTNSIWDRVFTPEEALYIINFH